MKGKKPGLALNFGFPSDDDEEEVNNNDLIFSTSLQNIEVSEQHPDDSAFQEIVDQTTNQKMEK